MSNINTTNNNKTVFSVVPKKVREQADKIYKTSSFWDAANNTEVNLANDRLLQRQDVDDIEKLVNIIYPKSRFSPTQLKDTNDDLINIGTLVRYFPRDHKKSKDQLLLAYVMREFRNSYRIFINEDCEDESFDSMDLHEKGHIIFNHTQNVSMYLAQFKKELEQIWDLKIAKYFENSTVKNSKDKIVKMLYAEFSNIAQDMEINSKLFDNGEWIKAKKTMARSGIIVHLKHLKSQFDDLSGLIKDPKARKINSGAYKKLLGYFNFILNNIKQRIEGEEGDFQFCYPSNKGWPEKLDWMTYMILLIKDIDETMDQIIKNVLQQIKQGGQGQGQGSGSGQGQGQGSGGKQISQEVLDNYFDQANANEDAQNDANGDSTVDEGDDDLDDEDSSGGSSVGRGRNTGGNSIGKGSGGDKVDIETCATFSDFTRFLSKNCLGKKNRRWNSDVLYNSNRGKFSSSVVVPRRHLIEKWMPTECHIIVDVSGSVPTEYVERVINSIIDTNSGIDLAHSHIIFCDEYVVSDEILSKRTREVFAGGGTCMANAIRYVKDKGYMKKATDKLFIISDMQDNLIDWCKEIRNLPGIHWAVGYNVRSEKEAIDTINGRHSYKSNSNSEFAREWNQCFKTIFITESL
jgi:hypothetical protein